MSYEDRIPYGSPDWDDSMFGDEADDFGPPATEAEAHLEWHRNSGVPVGEPCPWDACHSAGEEAYEEYLAQQAEEDAHASWLARFRGYLAGSFDTAEGSRLLAEIIAGAEQ